MRSFAGLLFILAAGTLTPAAGSAQDGDTLFGERVASVTFGPYARVEAGISFPSLDEAYWLPPGAADPRISFAPSLLDDREGFGAVALGYDWQNGMRADIAIFQTGTTDFVAPCAAASNGTPCNTHADITAASVSTSGVMGNFFYAPFEARGSTAIFQPFVVVGLGIAKNEAGPWTRTKNPANPTVGTNTVRSFAGDSTTDLAWSVGLGASVQLTRPGRWPVILEAALRHYDFGTASGSSTPLTAGSVPREPFTFDVTRQVATIGLRIPLERY